MLRKRKEKEKNEDLKKKFEEIKSKHIERADTRIVNVKIAVGCGCGGDYEWFHGEVPIDSDVEDGDYIDSLEEIGNPQSGYYE